MRFPYFFSLVFLVMFVSPFMGCMTVPVSERKAVNIIPESMEIGLGDQAYEEVLSKEKILKDSYYNEIVTRVGKRIAAIADKPNYEWDFKVIDSDTMNAFCLPGGKIAVYRGIFKVAKNEAGLATVVGHEVAHAIARHGGQRISTGIGLQVAAAAIQAGSMKNNPHAGELMAALGLGAQVGVMLPYGRMQETEADEIGQIFMARAGYEPEESVEFWKRFGEIMKGKSVPTLLSDHPSDESRQANMRDRLPKAKEEYRRAINKFGTGENFK